MKDFHSSRWQAIVEKFLQSSSVHTIEVLAPVAPDEEHAEKQVPAATSVGHEHRMFSKRASSSGVCFASKTNPQKSSVEQTTRLKIAATPR